MKISTNFSSASFNHDGYQNSDHDFDSGFDDLLFEHLEEVASDEFNFSDLGEFGEDEDNFNGAF